MASERPEVPEMNVRPLRVLQVGTVETGGGAASVAANLMRGYRTRGCEAWMAVGRKTSGDPAVFMIPDEDRAIYRMTGYVALQRRLRRNGEPVFRQRMGMAQPVASTRHASARVGGPGRRKRGLRVSRDLRPARSDAVAPGPCPLSQPARRLLRPARACRGSAGRCRRS